MSSLHVQRDSCDIWLALNGIDIPYAIPTSATNG
jgi:hypothetical protein